MYIVENTRIFTPEEVVKIYVQGEKPKSISMFLYQLSTGFAYGDGINYQKFLGEYFDRDKRIISFYSDKRWDKERIKRDRTIYLSYWDVMNIHNHLRYIDYTNPNRGVLRYNMQNWARAAGLDTTGIGVKSTRKTKFVWLLHAYPEYEDIIIDSMDYDPTRNSYVHPLSEDIDAYKNIKFDDKTSRHIKAITFGWSGAEI